MLALFVVACGKAGPPVPPEPRGPLPPALLSVAQRGDLTVVSLRVAPPRGDRPAQQPVQVDLFRVDFPPGIEPEAGVDAFVRRGVSVAELVGDPLDPGATIELADATTSAPADREEAASYVYALRVVDRRGRTSPLVVGEGISPRPDRIGPALTAASVPDGIELRWTVGERPVQLYRRTAGSDDPPLRVNAEPVESGRFVDTRVEIGRSYRYVARSLLTDASPLQEGSSGAPVEVTAVDRFPPSAPTDLVAVQEGGAVRLFWTPSPEPDVAAYLVYRRDDDGDWRPLGESSQPNWLDRTVAIGARYAYRVTTRDAASTYNESEPSSAVELTVVAEPVTGGPGGGA